MRVKKNLDKIIYDQIIDSFILGEYKMDDAISLDVLCEKYEVSRTPVVQAVKLLVNDEYDGAGGGQNEDDGQDGIGRILLPILCQRALVGD